MLSYCPIIYLYRQMVKHCSVVVSLSLMAQEDWEVITYMLLSATETCLWGDSFRCLNSAWKRWTGLQIEIEGRVKQDNPHQMFLTILSVETVLGMNDRSIELSFIRFIVGMPCHAMPCHVRDF